MSTLQNVEDIHWTRPEKKKKEISSGNLVVATIIAILAITRIYSFAISSSFKSAAIEKIPESITACSHRECKEIEIEKVNFLPLTKSDQLNGISKKACLSISFTMAVGGSWINAATAFKVSKEKDGTLYLHEIYDCE